MLTPLEIDNKTFPRVFKGYNETEVDDFLDQIAADYGKLYKENAELKNEIEQSKKDLEHYRKVEHTLQNTLVMAQSTAEDIKSVAQKQADQIIQEAQGEARKTVEKIYIEKADKQKELEELKRNFEVYKAKMEALLISQLELLKNMNEED